MLAGEKAHERTGEWLPEETIDTIREYVVAIKGPLTTPVGGGIRSLNVSLRQILDLYACVRPVRWIKGTPNPLLVPGKLDVVIFRENTEDVYAGIEWESGTKEAADIREYLIENYGVNIRDLSGIGIKPISPFGTKRLVRKAIEYAMEYKRRSVTLVHKGNIMKFTEGAFREWGYELAKEEFPDIIITEDELWDDFGGKQPEGKIVIKDRIADSMFQQILTRPGEYDVMAMPNLNGDYMSDACAAQVGRSRSCPGRQHRRLSGGLRSHSRDRSQVHRTGQGEPGLGHTLGSNDVPVPGVARGGGACFQGDGGDCSAEDGHL